MGAQLNDEEEQPTETVIRHVDAVLAALPSAIAFLEGLDELEDVTPNEYLMADEMWVIGEDDEPVGMALVETPDAEGGVGSVSSPRTGPDETWIHRLGIISEHRGKGLGRAFLEAIYEEHAPIELEVRASKPVNEFYDHLGLTLIEENPASFEDGEGIWNVWRWEETDNE